MVACVWLLVLLATALPGPVVLTEAHNATWPPYVRGKGQYVWGTSLSQRMRGFNFAGGNERLRRAMAKLLRGDPVLLSAVGGSITTGDIQKDGFPWPTYVNHYMTDQYGTHIKVTNNALGGTRTGYMGACHSQHIPRDADIIVLEYSVNDVVGGTASAIPEYVRRAQERLVRTLLRYTNRPAVMVAHSLTWWFKDTDNWDKTAEPCFNELSMYYALPTVSLKTCCFHELMTNAPGFKNPDPNSPNKGPGPNFFQDPAHLAGSTGARVLAELVQHALDTTIQSLKDRPYTQEEEDVVMGPLPLPLYRRNYESLHDQCFVGDSFNQLGHNMNGFEWINEAKAHRARFGFVATKPGASMELHLNTTASSLPLTDSVMILLAHLKSYEHMGTALVSCLSGCKCEGAKLYGHITDKHSQVYMQRIPVSQASHCVIKIQVLDETYSGEHKVKITSAVISEESHKSTDIGGQLIPQNSADNFNARR